MTRRIDEIVYDVLCELNERCPLVTWSAWGDEFDHKVNIVGKMQVRGMVVSWKHSHRLFQITQMRETGTFYDCIVRTAAQSLASEIVNWSPEAGKDIPEEGAELSIRPVCLSIDWARQAEAM